MSVYAIVWYMCTTLHCYGSAWYEFIVMYFVCVCVLDRMKKKELEKRERKKEKQLIFIKIVTEWIAKRKKVSEWKEEN